jgi:hypothetical protein
MKVMLGTHGEQIDHKDTFDERNGTAGLSREALHAIAQSAFLRARAESLAAV